MDKDDLLKIYGSLYGLEAGPWNLSLEQKYLEYRITQFFEENFPVPEGAQVCNVGIGAGYWDRYLSYNLKGGSLTSIDRDREICEAYAACLKNEGNPNPIEIISKDVMDCGEWRDRFDIVTMVGSARMESGLFEDILEMLFSFLKPGGGLYYQSLDPKEDPEAVQALCGKEGLKIQAYLLDEAFGRKAQYWKIIA